MYALLGFIHVLLMLTQSRFTPDLNFLTIAEVRSTFANPVSQHTFQIPVQGGERLSFETMLPGDKEKLKQSFRTESRIALYLLNIKTRNRADISQKLYLMLGQLKTDG